jgi:hypothetical protein
MAREYGKGVFSAGTSGLMTPWLPLLSTRGFEVFAANVFEECASTRDLDLHHFFQVHMEAARADFRGCRIS